MIHKREAVRDLGIMEAQGASLERIQEAERRVQQAHAEMEASAESLEDDIRAQLEYYVELAAQRPPQAQRRIVRARRRHGNHPPT